MLENRQSNYDQVIENWRLKFLGMDQEELIRKEECIRLYEAISPLTPLQRRRIQMLMEDMNYTQIARAEGRNPSVIYRSIQGSFLHLRRLLKE